MDVLKFEARCKEIQLSDQVDCGNKKAGIITSIKLFFRWGFLRTKVEVEDGGEAVTLA